MTPLLIIPELFGVSIEVYFILIFLSVPTYFFWRWVLKKFISDDKSRKGTKPGLFAIDPDYLDIDFKNGRVIHVSQHTS